VSRALITGCSSGIGRAVAVELARRGVEVVATARDPGELDGLDVAERHRLDVSSASQVDELVARIAPVDILVNNAGFGVHGPLEAIPMNVIEKVFDVNLLGALRVTKALLPSMRTRGGGTIVLVSSPAGRATRPLTGVYGASKAALELAFESLSFELEPTGGRVIVIEPGAVSSSFGTNRHRYDLAAQPYTALAERWAGVLRESHGSRASTPEEVAAVVATAIEDEKQAFSRHPVGAEAAALLRRRAELDDAAYRAKVWDQLGGVP